MTGRTADANGYLRVQSLLMVLATATLTFFNCLLTGAGADESVRNVVCACIGAGVIVYLMHADAERARAQGGVTWHKGRFTGAYLAALVCALLLTHVTYHAWPFTAVYALLLFYSDTVTGFLSGSVLLLVAVLFVPEHAFAVFGVYLLAAAVMCALFAQTDKETNTLQLACIVALLQGVLTVAFHILFLHKRLQTSVFVIPIINCCYSVMLLMLLARIYTSRILQTDEQRYNEINDTEFSLMAAIRAKSKDEYFHAIHTAYLVDRVASGLHLNVGAAKACANYCRIGCLDDKETDWYEVAHYYTEFDFPQEALSLLKEYLTMGRLGPQSKEATVVSLCDEWVTTLTSIFRKNKDAQVGYDAMIDRLCADRLASGALARSDLSVRELNEAAALLKQEKLYYDFLR